MKHKEISVTRRTNPHSPTNTRTQLVHQRFSPFEDRAGKGHESIPKQNARQLRFVVA